VAQADAYEAANEAQGGLATAVYVARVWASNHSESAANSKLLFSTALLTRTTSLAEASTYLPCKDVDQCRSGGESGTLVALPKETSPCDVLH
jgi:hypothetical protein